VERPELFFTGLTMRQSRHWYLTSFQATAPPATIIATPTSALTGPAFTGLDRIADCGATDGIMRFGARTAAGAAGDTLIVTQRAYAEKASTGPANRKGTIACFQMSLVLDDPCFK
jgi:hypothetical protein